MRYYTTVGFFTFFTNVTRRNNMSSVVNIAHNSSLNESLRKARVYANFGDPKSEHMYKQIIEKYPKCEAAYEELFNVICNKRSVFGLKPHDIEPLRKKYLENFGSKIQEAIQYTAPKL